MTKNNSLHANDKNNNNDDSRLEEKKKMKISVNSGMKPLNNDFFPTPKDVICSRGNVARKHEGNIKFRDLINENLKKYSTAGSKIEKSNIVWSIVKKVRYDSPNGGFVKQINTVWYEVGDHLAREKIGQSLRDSLHSQYRSSTKAKKRRRWEEQAKVDNQMYGYLHHQSDYKDIIDLIKKISNQKINDTDIQDKFNDANFKLLNAFKSGKQQDKNNKNYHEQLNRCSKRSKRQFIANNTTRCFGSFSASSLTLSASSSLGHDCNLEPIPLNDIREFDHNVLRYIPSFYSAQNILHYNTF